MAAHVSAAARRAVGGLAALRRLAATRLSARRRSGKPAAAVSPVAPPALTVTVLGDMAPVQEEHGSESDDDADEKQQAVIPRGPASTRRSRFMSWFSQTEMSMASDGGGPPTSEGSDPRPTPTGTPKHGSVPPPPSLAPKAAVPVRLLNASPSFDLTDAPNTRSPKPSRLRNWGSLPDIDGLVVPVAESAGVSASRGPVSVFASSVAVSEASSAAVEEKGDAGEEDTRQGAEEPAEDGVPGVEAVPRVTAADVAALRDFRSIRREGAARLARPRGGPRLRAVLSPRAQARLLLPEVQGMTMKKDANYNTEVLKLTRSGWVLATGPKPISVQDKVGRIVGAHNRVRRVLEGRIAKEEALVADLRQQLQGELDDREAQRQLAAALRTREAELKAAREAVLAEKAALDRRISEDTRAAATADTRAAAEKRFHTEIELTVQLYDREEAAAGSMRNMESAAKEHVDARARVNQDAEEFARRTTQANDAVSASLQAVIEREAHNRAVLVQKIESERRVRGLPWDPIARLCALMSGCVCAHGVCVCALMSV